MVAFHARNPAQPNMPRLRPGDMVEIEVPWTVDLPSPHRSGVLSGHFTLEQCTILCEAIEEARHAGQRRRCRLVDRFSYSWVVEIEPGRDDKAGHLRWSVQAKPRKATS